MTSVNWWKLCSKTENDFCMIFIQALSHIMVLRNFVAQLLLEMMGDECRVPLYVISDHMAAN